MERLWLRLTEVWGHRWVSAYGDDPGGSAGQTWGKGLAGLAVDEIAHGLDRAILSADPWPPTLPEFRALCLDVPSLAQVRADIGRTDEERLPFTRMVWRHIDAWAYRNADRDKADRMLRDAYEIARDQRMTGAPLPETQRAIVQDTAPREYPPSDPEFRQRCIDEAAEVLGLKERAA